MNKTYRCLTCGFAFVVDSSDERSLEELNEIHHKTDLAGVKNKGECPACHGYLKRFGGRKNGKVEMPDITAAGVLEDEETVKDQLDELNKDFSDLNTMRGNGKLVALRKKYNGKKLFGYSVDDLIEIHDKNVK